MKDSLLPALTDGTPGSYPAAGKASSSLPLRLWRVSDNAAAGMRAPNASRGAHLVPLWLLLACFCFVSAGCGMGGLSGEGGVGSQFPGGGGAPGDGPSGPWTIETVDNSGDAGHLVSLALGPAGTPWMSYFAYLGGSWWIRHAVSDGWSWEASTVYETDTKTGCALAVDPAGRAAMAFVGGESQPLYYWPFQSDLLLARAGGESWNLETVEEDGVVGLWPSLAFDPLGRPGISYQDLGNGIDYNDFHLRDLKYAHLGATGWDIETVEEDGGGYYTRLQFDAEGQPAIAYCGNPDADTQSVKLAIQGDYGWEIHVIDAAGECEEGSISARSRPQGGIGVAFYDGREEDLKYASNSGGTWRVETVEAHNRVGKYCSLAYGQDGEPLVSYYYCGRSTDSDCQGGGDLRLARRVNGNWETETVDTRGNTGMFTSLAVAPGGETWIAYYDSSLTALKLAVRR